jgi:hypothetical protein
MSNAILYQAYGGNDFINECKYSLLKYLQVYNLAPPAETSIVIYTDQPNQFSDFLPFFHRFTCKQLTANLVREWRGAQNFVHRLKIEMLADFTQTFTGNVLYCDTDAYLKAPIEEVFEDMERGSFYMHEYEGTLNKATSPSFHKWEKFLSSTPVVYNDKQVEFSNAIKMYNAGVVGFNSGHKELLNDVLRLTDVVYLQFPKHIAEQFAFSYCFQKAGVIKSADSVVAHYWNLKEFRRLLASFFASNLEESIPNLVKKLHHVDALTIMGHKASFKALPFWHRFLKNLSGSPWRIENYQKRPGLFRS